MSTIMIQHQSDLTEKETHIHIIGKFKIGGESMAILIEPGGLPVCTHPKEGAERDFPQNHQY